MHHHRPRMMTSAAKEFAQRCRKCCSRKIANLVACLCSAKKTRVVFFSASAWRNSSCPLFQRLWVIWEAMDLQLAVVAERVMGLEASCLDSSVTGRVLKNSSRRPWSLPAEGTVEGKQWFALETAGLWSSDWACESSTCRFACVQLSLILDPARIAMAAESGGLGLS